MRSFGWLEVEGAGETFPKSWVIIRRSNDDTMIGSNAAFSNRSSKPSVLSRTWSGCASIQRLFGLTNTPPELGEKKGGGCPRLGPLSGRAEH
jgi:hypothetical protein